MTTLKDLKVGDPVLISGRFGALGRTSIAEITKAGNFKTTGGGIYNAQGRQRTADKYYCSYLHPFDPDAWDREVSKRKHNALVTKVSSVTWGNLPTDLLQAIDFMLQTHAQAKELEKPEGDNGSGS